MRVQPKLTVNAPGDAAEVEADRVADSVMRMPAPGVQRKCAACDAARGATCPDCEEEAHVQRKADTAGGHGGEVGSDFASRLGGGAPLDAASRAFFEPRFGRDFGDVRVHAGTQADSAARSIQARAFTLGRDIAFASGEYDAGSDRSRSLLAHELVHVVQQGGGGERKVQRTTFDGCTQDEIDTHIQPALDDADEHLGKAIAALDVRPLSDTAKAALWLAFRSESEATADTVKERLEEIKTGLPDGDIECEHSAGDPLYTSFCPTNRYGYVLGLGSIHLCMHLFPSMSKIRKAHAMIHEGGHRYAWFIGDSGYLTNSCEETEETATLSPSGRLSNSDNYACFVFNIKHGTNLGTRSDAFKGKNLALRQNPAGAIDLNAAAASTTFEVTGAPSHSGFEYRWVISDALNNSFLMRADSGNPFAFGNHPEAFIGAKTRALLKEKGITAAEVRCRAKIPGFSLSESVLIKLPVTFTL